MHAGGSALALAVRERDLQPRHRTARAIIERVASLVTEINRDACTVADRLRVKAELDSEEEKLRFSA